MERIIQSTGLKVTGGRSRAALFVPYEGTRAGGETLGWAQVQE